MNTDPKSTFLALLSLLFAGFILQACTMGSNTHGKPVKDRLYQFESIKGIKFQEVKRRFSNGLSFDTSGFQQEPSWIIEVASEDSMSAWSPQKERWQNFYLHYDHGDVYNFADEWFKVKHMSKDSLVLQRVEVNSRVIAQGIASDVNMTFYPQPYIKNVLKTTAAELQKPSKADTAFILERTQQTNFPDSAFAARNPVVFTPKSKIITVEKKSNVDKLNNKTASYDYMYPEYIIHIDRAYRDFSYLCKAIVDTRGRIKVTKVYGVLDEDKDSRRKQIQSVSDIYLRNLLMISPGRTLNIPHNSEVILNIIGKKMP